MEALERVREPIQTYPSSAESGRTWETSAANLKQRSPLLVRSAVICQADFALRYRQHSSREQRATYEIAKRFLDVTVSAFLLILALPLFLVVSFLVAATSRGPVFFRQRRLGRGGEEFHCLKFRSMVQDAERILITDATLLGQFRSDFKLRSDPRTTPIGAVLRKFSIDELPQLLNVLTGEMSLIGPRPIVKAELEKYGEHGDDLLSVKPGLGGLWQVCGRSDTTYPERIYFDTTYVQRRCLVLDFQLLVRTVLAVITARGSR